MENKLKSFESHQESEALEFLKANGAWDEAFEMQAKDIIPEANFILSQLAYEKDQLR